LDGYGILVEAMSMKFTKIDINNKLFGNGFIVYDWKETEDTIEIFIKSTIHSNRCPSCGQSLQELHNTYHRRLQTIPIRGKTTYVDMNAYKYNCTNEV